MGFLIIENKNYEPVRKLSLTHSALIHMYIAHALNSTFVLIISKCNHKLSQERSTIRITI